jgi:signal transduction histidine kinase
MSTLLREAFSVTRLSFWTGALLSSLIGASLYMFTHRSIESDTRERFFNHARYAQSVINVRAKSYTNLLRGTASLFQSTDVPTHRQFHEYVRGLELVQNFPAVDFINYSQYVLEQERPAFLEKLDAETPRIPDDTTRATISPPGIRPYYLATLYVEPHPPRADLYGVDIMANRYFGKHLLVERDEGKLFSTGTPIPVLSRPNDIYIGLRMPVYRMDLPLDNVEQRRIAYRGSIGIAFSIPKLLQGVIDEMPVSGVRMTLFDAGSRINARGQSSSGRLLTLFDSQGSASNPKPPLDTGNDVFSITLPLDFNGRPWQTTYSVRKAAMYTSFDDSYPKMMMSFGFIGSILLYALLFILTSSRRAALALAQEMTSELRESQSKLQLSHQKLRRLADHAYQVKELERKRIAREVHDDLGQNLLALRIEAEMLATRSKTHSHLHKRASATLQQIDTTIKSVRQIINDLRPTVLDLGLSAAVEWQVNQFQRRTGIQCEIHDDHGEIAMPDYCATAFFRILQESLTNIVRHANASRVVVELRLNGGWLSLIVRDNGCGLPPGGRNKHGSFGLVGIEERILILGGTCAVFSERDGGTTIMVSAPVVGLPDSEPQLLSEHESGSAVL